MRDAIAIASAATNTGDVPVGAIVINKDGIVIGKGSNEREANNDQLHTLRLWQFVTLPVDCKILGSMAAHSL